MQLEAAAAAVHEELAAMLMQLGAKVVFGIHPMACAVWVTPQMPLIRGWRLQRKLPLVIARLYLTQPSIF